MLRFERPISLACRVIVPTLVLLCAALLLSTHSAKASPTGQVQLFGVHDINGSGYSGAWAAVTTPNPAINDGKAGMPTGVTNWVNTYIESGPVKYCTLGCGLHPYMSYGSVNRAPSEVVLLGTNLAAGGVYEYKSYFIGNNLWEAQWCDFNGCYPIRQVDLATSNTLPAVASGGETSGVALGSATTFNTKLN